jgi:indolepyruvate ferredoxin oxidoreductase
MSQSNISLDDRYCFDGRPFYLNGTQSLVRLTMLELRRRAAQGRRTAVYATGYRGSPLGGLDQAMQGAAKFLGDDIVFRPAVNEDLAATAVWGTQQLGIFGEGRYDGVSALWYGKGPGVDRTGDAFKHGNLAGSAREGGVLVVAGDDHTCKSSTTAHQSEFALIAAMIPVLAPSSVAEQMEYGLIGWELSRATGLWAGLKVVTEIMDSGESLPGDAEIRLVNPGNPALLADGLSLRWPDTPLAQEERLHRHKLPAAIEFARANRLDRVILGNARARLGLITVGKAYADTRQALSDLGLDERRASELGIRLYKVAMPWPLEPAGIRDFARGLEEILVVEEKRGLVEDQVPTPLRYAKPAAHPGQARRAGRVAVSVQRRSGGGSDRTCARQAHPACNRGRRGVGGAYAPQ